jgi:hypothetical protein
MAADPTYLPKIQHRDGGNTLVVAPGGVLDIETGGIIKTNGTQGAALTTQLTTITPADAEGTPDYAIAAVITGTGAYGTSNAQELITLLYVIKNLQVRMAEVEARLEAAGFVAAN